MIRVFSVRILYIRVDDSHGDDGQATIVNNPPRDRTTKLRALGFPTRHLGPVQMTTDTALGVTKCAIVDCGSLLSPFFSPTTGSLCPARDNQSRSTKIHTLFVSSRTSTYSLEIADTDIRLCLPSSAWFFRLCVGCVFRVTQRSSSTRAKVSRCPFVRLRKRLFDQNI